MARTRVRGSQQLNAELLDLNDTPSSYSGSGDFLVRIKDTEDGIEFVDKDVIIPPVAWVNDIFVSNGTTRVYELSNTPITNSLIVALEGMSLTIGASNDYTISGTTFTLSNSVPIESGMKLDITYVSSDNLSPGFKNWVIIENDYTATNGDKLIIDATSGLEITLPLSPTLSDEVFFLDGAGNFETMQPIVKRNGQKIMRLSEDLTIDKDNVGFRLVYTGTAWGWLLYPI